MSTLRTYNLQNPDSSNVNIELTQGSGAVVAGVATFSSDVRVSGNLTVDGVLTYDDVTNIDSVGIITARSDIRAQGNIIGDNSTNISGINSVTATKFYGDGSQLTGIDATQIVTGNTSVQTVDTGSDGHVKVNTEGSERLRIASNGKVGIGTDNPADKLSIYAAPNSLVFGAKDTTRGNHIFQLLADDSAGNGELRLYKNSGSGTHEKTVEIASSGVSYFTGGALLVAKSTTSLTTQGSRVDNGLITVSGDSSSTNLAVNGGGNLSLANIDSTDNNFSNIGGYNSNGLVVSQIDFINTSHSSRTGDIAFLTHNGSAMSERMRIMSDGTVKIGTGTGNPILMLNASTSGTSVIQMGDSADNNIGQIHYANSMTQ